MAHGGYADVPALADRTEGLCRLSPPSTFRGRPASEATPVRRRAAAHHPRQAAARRGNAMC